MLKRFVGLQCAEWTKGSLRGEAGEGLSGWGMVQETNTAKSRGRKRDRFMHSDSLCPGPQGK